MAVEVPKDYFDKLVHEQIDLSRYSNSLVKDILTILNAADRELVAKIAKRGEDGTMTASRLKALLKEIRADIQAAYAEIQKSLQGELEAFAVHAGETTVAMLAPLLPAPDSLIAISAEQLAAIVSRVPISLGKDKKLLFAEIFVKLTEGKDENIKGAIRLGMVQGESIERIVRRIKGTRANRYLDGILEGGRREITALVRTAVLHTSNQAALATFSANDDIIKGWIAVATLDSRTCIYCMSRSGKRYPMTEAPPPWHIGDRCYMVPDVMTWREMGIDRDEFSGAKRASKDGLVSVEISMNDWLKTQDKGTQVKLLGKARAEIFAKGGITVDRFVDSSGDLYTLEELRARKL